MLIPAGMLVGIAVTSLILGRGSESVRPDQPGQVSVAAVAGAGDTLTAPGVPAEVEEFLRNGQYWRAARAMRAHLASAADPHPAAVLLAARAEAGWGGWGRARRYLEGREWLSEMRGGEGWYWLGRSLEEEGDLPGAARAYGEYLRAARADGRGGRALVAELRRGLLMLRSGETGQGVALLESMRGGAPAMGPWLDLMAAEALAETGDTARVVELAHRVEVPELWLRGRRAVLAAYGAAGDPVGLREMARRYREQAGDAAARAELGLAMARASLAIGDTAAAREELRGAISGAPSAPAARTAADLIGRTGRLTAGDRLAIATVLDRQGDNPGAAAGYAAWLQSGAGTAAERARVRLRMGSALFDAGRYPDAISALRPLATAGGAEGAGALLLIGRAEYRRGNRARANEIWLDLAERHPGSAAGAEGLFLLADLAHDDGDEAYAARIYRRVIDGFRGTDRAGLSSMRLAGIAYRAGDWARAAAVWEEYRATYPDGQRWLEATYWAGRARERAGDTAAARELYAAVRTREPLSYYALTSAQRLEEPFWPIPMAAPPAENADARARIERWMESVDLLLEAGLHRDAETEADRWITQAGEDPALLYPLAEALNERGLTVRGIRIGLRLQKAVERPDERLLRIVYPFPYRAMVVAEAAEKGLDPFLVAALTRQESLFKARITSPAGARGLMQVMPETGALLARSARIDDWEAELLYQPEINVHLGTRYLADQVRRYDGSLPAVFSAYNAGPHRIDRWMDIYPEWGDEQLFTERIPYRETRDYVKILTRNIAIYRALHGEAARPGY